MNFWYKVILFLALLSILHSGYSAAQYRSYLRLNEQQYNGLPSDLSIRTNKYEVKKTEEFSIEEKQYDGICYNPRMSISIQGLTSLLVAMYCILHIAGEFKEIRATSQLENKNWETLGNRPSFYVFSHRGQSLSPNYSPRNKMDVEVISY